MYNQLASPVSAKSIRAQRKSDYQPALSQAPEWPGRLEWSVAILLTVVVIVLPMLLVIDPVSYLLFILEDSLGEMTSFSAFAVAGLIFLLRTWDDRKTPKNYWYLLFAVIAFFLAGEEISWGQRIAQVSTPDFLRELNAQGEINLHNLSASAMQGTYLVITAALFCYGVLLPIVYRFSRPVRGLIDTLGLPVPALVLMPLFAAPVLIWTGPNIVRNDEIVELIIAMGMFGIAIFEVDNLKWLARSRRLALRPNVGLLLAGLAFCFLAGGMLAGLTSFGTPYERQMFMAAKYQLPNAGYVREAGVVLGHLEQMPEYGHSPLFLVTKGRNEIRQGFQSEATRTLTSARDIALRQLPERQGQFSHQLLLAEIHTLLGEQESARQRAESALTILESASRAQPAIAVSESANDDIAQDKIRRGNVYFAIQNHQTAFDHYVDAATVAHWSSTRLKISRKLGQVIASCSGRPYAALTWEETEALAASGPGALSRYADCQ